MFRIKLVAGAFCNKASAQAAAHKLLREIHSAMKNRKPYAGPRTDC